VDIFLMVLTIGQKTHPLQSVTSATGARKQTCYATFFSPSADHPPPWTAEGVTMIFYTIEAVSKLQF
jgi:hypothetical protein